MSERRTLAFHSEDEVIAELGWLRRGYKQLGAWNLPQSAWHLSALIDNYLVPPENLAAKPTPEQAERQAGFFAKARAPRGFDNMTAPPEVTPPADCTVADVDRFVGSLRTLKAYPHDVVQMGPIGPAPITECRNVHLAHAAHHLSYLIPTAPPRRAGLSFGSADDVIADVTMLRAGWQQTAGQWTLPQICWHLNVALQAGMTPAPDHVDTPEQLAAKPMLQPLLASRRVPAIQSPPRAIPPDDAGEPAIAELLRTLDKFKSFPGPFGPHRMFGRITDEEMRKLQLIHCAHHLSYLSPKGV